MEIGTKRKRSPDKDRGLSKVFIRNLIKWVNKNYLNFNKSFLIYGSITVVKCFVSLN